MARKKEPKVPAVSVVKKPVRVDLLPADYKRLERQARKLDRSLSWYAAHGDHGARQGRRRRGEVMPVYFAQLPTGSIKIGYSDDVESRMKALESSYRQPLALLHTIEGDRKAEHKIHERFAHLRFGRTEQFRPGLDLMEFIGLPVLVSANPDAVVVVEPPRDDIAVKLDRSVVADARYVAYKRGISLAQYLTDIVRPMVAKDFQQVTKGGK